MPMNLGLQFYSTPQCCALYYLQGRIKVRGGPGLDTVMGALPFFHLLLSTTHTESLGFRPPPKKK